MTQKKGPIKLHKRTRNQQKSISRLSQKKFLKACVP